MNIYQTKSLDIYRWIFCIIRQYNCKHFVPVFFWNNVLENIMLKQNHQYIFHRLTFSLDIIFFWQHLCKLNLLGHLCWLNLLKTLIDFIILYNSKKNPYIFLFFDISFLSFHVHVYNYPLAISLTVSILKEQHLFLFVFFSESFLSFFLQTKNFAFCISFFKQLVLLLLLWQHHAAYIPILLNVFR